MKYFLDTEFNERGYEHPIELISIALVCEDGREYYAVASNGWSPEDVSNWLKENVLPYLSIPGSAAQIANTERIPRTLIANEIRSFVSSDTKVEFWGYFADYDWVLFCQLFGRMIDLPKHFPKYCFDIKQEMEVKGIKKSDLPKQDEQAHNALADARHMKKMFEFVESIG